MNSYEKKSVHVRRATPERKATSSASGRTFGAGQSYAGFARRSLQDTNKAAFGNENMRIFTLLKADD